MSKVYIYGEPFAEDRFNEAMDKLSEVDSTLAELIKMMAIYEDDDD